MNADRFRTGLLVAMLFLCFAPVLGQDPSGGGNEDHPDPCGMAMDVLDPLVSEAERLAFNVRYIEIAGNTYTRYREFAKRMLQNEGDIFRRELLEKTVLRISRMKTIYPVLMENVEVRLNREQRVIDIVFCVRQKPKH